MLDERIFILIAWNSHYFFIITNIFQLFDLFKVITNNVSSFNHNFLPLFTSEVLLQDQVSLWKFGTPLLRIQNNILRKFAILATSIQKQ